jgi:hypothetical protein
MYGASPMPKALLEPALKMFPNAKFRQGYGMTGMFFKKKPNLFND